MKGGDRRRRKGSVYLLLSFIFPLFLYLSLSQCRSLPQSPAASWDSGIDSHRRLRAAKKTTKNNNRHHRHRHYISGHHEDRYLPEWYSSPVPVTSANCISRCSWMLCLRGFFCDDLICYCCWWCCLTTDLHVQKQSTTWSIFFNVLSRLRIERNLISIMFLESCVNRRQVYRVCRCARSPVDHFRRKPTVRLNKIRMIEKVRYGMFGYIILWGTHCWVDYLRIVVC